MLGEPGNREKHLNVLRDTLKCLETILEAGGHVELPYRWEAAPVMWGGKPLMEGSYS